MKDLALNPSPAKFLAPTYAFLASDLASNVTGKMFTASGGYVGLWGIAPEQFIAHKDHADGSPWQLDELALEFGKASLI